jgi:hypothetical protein
VRGQHPLLRVFEDDALRGRDAQSRRDVQEEIRMRLDAGDTLVGRDRLEVSREVESAQDRLDVLPVRRRRQGESPVSMECLDEGERAGHGTERGLHQRHEDAELRPPEDVRIVVEPAPAYEVIDPEAGADPMVGEFLFRDLEADTSERLAPRLAVKAFGVGQEPVEVEDDRGDHWSLPLLRDSRSRARENAAPCSVARDRLAVAAQALGSSSAR